MTTQLEIERLAAALDGTLEASEMSRELLALVKLAGAVQQHTVVPLPTAAFRESLRADLLQSITAPGAAVTAATAPTTATGVTAVAAGAKATIASWVASATAAALLAGSGVAALAPNAVPGDALYDAKRAMESGQLAFGGVESDAALLLRLATERLEEALGVLDASVIAGLLDESQQHLDEALALLDGLPEATAEQLLGEFLPLHTLALLDVLEHAPDASTAAKANELLARTAAVASTVPDVDVPTTDGDPGTGGQGDGVTDPVDGATDGVTDPVDDVIDGVTDPIDGATDGVTDPIDDVIDGVTDPIDGATDGVTDPIDDVIDDVTDTVQDTTGTVGELLP